MRFIIFLSFVLMYFILWCFLKAASIADREYEKEIKLLKRSRTSKKDC